MMRLADPYVMGYLESGFRLIELLRFRKYDMQNLV